jgi:hypothetical protein
VVTKVSKKRVASIFTLKTEALHSSETLVTTHETTRRHKPEDHNRHITLVPFFLVTMTILKFLIVGSLPRLLESNEEHALSLV